MLLVLKNKNRLKHDRIGRCKVLILKINISQFSINRKISITRELTKVYEDIISSDLENIESLINERQLNNKPLKGEIVIIINGYTKNYNMNIETLRANIKKKLQKFSLRDTVNLTVDETNFPRKLIYNEAVNIKKLITEK